MAPPIINPENIEKIIQMLVKSEIATLFSGIGVEESGEIITVFWRTKK